MDFWSNIATTSVQVELNNPAPALDAIPPDDNFTGNTLYPGRWRTDLACGGIISQQDGRVIFSTGNKEKYSSGTILPTWDFPEDFDVQVDFQIGEGCKNPAEGRLDGAVFGVTIGGQSYWVTRLMSGGRETAFSMNSIDTISGEMVSSALTSKYRLIRTGTRLFILFDLG